MQQIQPYLMFEGRCDEAIEFYQGALGAKLEFVLRNDETPEPPPPGMLPPGSERKICHAEISIGDSRIMLSDGMCGGTPQFGGFSLSVPVPDEATARRTFDALAAGGQVRMPLGKTFFSPCFGMVQDRFGVGWMVIIPQEPPV
jgi:PhnB protein